MIRSKSLFPLAIVLLVGFAALMFLRAPAASLPSLTMPAVQQAAASRTLIRSNWGEIELDVEGALDHATARHGAAGAEALRLAHEGRCLRALLQCGYDWQHLAEGVGGYFVCALGDGRYGIVPFRADGLAHRLVAMTGYPVQPGYEKYLAQRDDCVPVELLGLLLVPELEKDYADD